MKRPRRCCTRHPSGVCRPRASANAAGAHRADATRYLRAA